MTVAKQDVTATSGRRSLKAKMRIAVLTERIDVDGPEVAIFRFKPKDQDLFEFVAGQYATLGLDVGDEFVPRAYSIASSPYERSYLARWGLLHGAPHNLRWANVALQPGHCLADLQHGSGLSTCHLVAGGELTGFFV